MTRSFIGRCSGAALVLALAVGCDDEADFQDEVGRLSVLVGIPAESSIREFLTGVDVTLFNVSVRNVEEARFIPVLRDQPFTRGVDLSAEGETFFLQIVNMPAGLYDRATVSVQGVTLLVDQDSDTRFDTPEIPEGPVFSEPEAGAEPLPVSSRSACYATDGEVETFESEIAFEVFEGGTSEIRLIVTPIFEGDSLLGTCSGVSVEVVSE